MGLFDSIISGVSNFLGGGDQLDSPLDIAGDLSGLPSELGGSLLDQLQGSGGNVADLQRSINFGGAASDPFGGIFGDLSGSGGGSSADPYAGIPPLDTTIPITLSGAGGSMADLSTLGTFGPFMRARRPGVPWKRITRMVRTAVKYFGPSVAMAIVQQLAALLAGNGVTDASGNAITGGEILYRSLQQGGGSRRSRGITGRQLSITGKTIRKLNAMHAKISHIARSGGGARRAAPAAKVYAFQRPRRAARA